MAFRAGSRIGAVFRDFYRNHRHEIWRLVGTREVQINKLGRLALLAPVFLEIARVVRGPLAFVDVGCSVGLGLLWPHCRYSYTGPAGPGRICAGGDVDLACAVRGVPSISLDGTLPKPRFLCGIERAPLLVARDSDSDWLLALTGPNDHAGRERLQRGLALLDRVRPRIEHGCALDVLPRLAAEWEAGDCAVIYHSMTMHHLQDEGKLGLLSGMLRDLSRHRRVFEAGVEWVRSEDQAAVPVRVVEVTLCEWHPGGGEVRRVATADRSADGTLLSFE